MTGKRRLSCAAALLPLALAQAQRVSAQTLAQAPASGRANAAAPNAPGVTAPAASTQDNTGQADIIVTAQKRSERLSQVPITITAASGDQLARQGVTNTEQLERVVPGFTFTKTNFGTPVYTLRGIGFNDNSIGSSAAVAVYLDQVPLPYSVETRGATLDLERVEVLNGPQGTLFGQNATGGAINYVAAKPTSALQAGADLTYGRFNEVDGQGFISGPLTDTVSVRIAGRYEYRGDWQKGFDPNDSAFGQTSAKLGARRFFTGRLLLDWKPTDRLSVEIGADGWQDGSDTQAQQFVRFAPASAQNVYNAADYAAYATQQPLPKDDRLAGWTAGRDYGRDDHFVQVHTRIDYDLTDDVKLTSLSAYSTYRERSLIDADAAAIQEEEVSRRAAAHSFSQELRVAATTGPLKLTAGGNYEHDYTNDNLRLYLKATNSGIGPHRYDGLDEPDVQHVDTYAAFADVEYAITHTLSLVGGARYTKQDRDYQGCVADPGDGTLAAAFAATYHTAPVPGGCVSMDSPATNRLLPNIKAKLDQDNVAWRGGVNWKPTNNALLYANVTKGYKSGSFPIIPGVYARQFQPVTQESVLAYEGGFKLSLAQRRIQLNGAIFYYDYKNKQLLGNVLVPPFGRLATLVNIPKSRVYGAELQAVLQPISGLRVTGGVTYVNTRVQQDPTAPTDAFGQSVSFVGESFPDTPRWQAVTDAEYRFSVGPSYAAFLGAGTTTRTSTSAAFGDSSLLRIPGYTLLDVRAGFETSNGNWRLELWGHNVTNKYYITNIVHQIDVVAAYTGMPATYGATLSYRFR